MVLSLSKFAKMQLNLSQKLSSKLLWSFIVLTILLGVPNAYCAGEEKEAETFITIPQKPKETIDEEGARDNAGSLSVLPPEVFHIILNNFGMSDLSRASLVCRYFSYGAKTVFNNRHRELARDLAPADNVLFETLIKTPQENLSAIHFITYRHRSQRNEAINTLLLASPQQLKVIRKIADDFVGLGIGVISKDNLAKLLESENKNVVNADAVFEIAKDLRRISISKAVELYRLAANQGHEGARSALNQIEENRARVDLAFALSKSMREKFKITF